MARALAARARTRRKRRSLPRRQKKKRKVKAARKNDLLQKWKRLRISKPPYVAGPTMLAVDMVFLYSFVEAFGLVASGDLA